MALGIHKLALAILTLILLTTSCSNRSAKANTEQKETTNKEEVVIKKETPPSKSKYEVRKELEKYFVHQKDGSTEQVQSKNVSAAGLGTYCYFYIKGKRAISLKFKINYPQHNANLYELEVGGVVKAFESNKTHTTAQTATFAEGSTFQWYDKAINEEDEAFIRKLGKADGATLRLKYKNEDREVEVTTIHLSKEECQTLVHTIDYYKSLDSATIPKKGMVNIRG